VRFADSSQLPGSRYMPWPHPRFVVGQKPGSFSLRMLVSSGSRPECSDGEGRLAGLGVESGLWVALQSVIPTV